MTRLVRPWLVLAVLPLALGASSGAAMFHTRLTKSTPEADTRIAAAPKEIRLWFSEPVEAGLSTIVLQGSDSARIAMSKVRKTDEAASVIADVTGAVVPGTYRVTWKTAGKDGHAVRGTFTFSIGK